MIPHAELPDSDDYLHRVRPPRWANPAPQPRYDLVVIGGGPAGQSAALLAAQSGHRVALIERAELGGNSLNAGSIPSKVLVRSGRAYEAIANSQRCGGPPCVPPPADFRAVMQRMRAIRGRIAERYSAARLTDMGIDVFFGQAEFAGPSLIQVQALNLHFTKALIATGSSPMGADIPGLQSTGYLTSTALFQLDRLPRRLAIIGGGPLGCEMAQAFAHFGSRVTILQDQPKFLPCEERDAAELLSLSLARSGVEIRLNTTIAAVRRENSEKLIDAESAGDRYTLAVDEILVSVGRRGNSSALQIAAAGVVRHADGRIETDDFLRTSNPAVYAAGDVCMRHRFVNVAEASAEIAVRNALLQAEMSHYAIVAPRCTYCDPEIAHIGMHIWDAHRQSIPVHTYTILMQDVDRAITDGRDEGFLKIHVRAGTDQIIGASIVASRASEMINEMAIIMHAKVGMRALAQIKHTYPSQSDAIRLAARAYTAAHAHARR